MTCNICLDEMDMLEFNDTRPRTETCFKLECGHAYHTKCVVEFLTRTRHKCPGCNTEKSFEEQLSREGIALNLIRDIKKTDTIKNLRNEYTEATSEYVNLLKVIGKETRDFVHKRAEELRIKEHKNYYFSTRTAIKNACKEIAKDMGNKYVSAINVRKRRGYNVTILEEEMFGKRTWSTGYRREHPRIFVNVLSTAK